MHIALIAHNARKSELFELARDFRGLLQRPTVTATAGTGAGLRCRGIEARTVLSGPEGGDLEIGAMVARGEIDAVIFFRDEQTEHPHAPDIAALVRICKTRRVPIANTRFHAHKVLEQVEVALDLRDIGTGKAGPFVSANDPSMGVTISGSPEAYRPERHGL